MRKSWMHLLNQVAAQRSELLLLTGDQGYGLVCDEQGRVMDDYIVAAVNQEHGTITHRSGDPARGLDLPVGTLLRILPNHACATCAQFEAYQVIDAANQLQATWPRFGGW